MRLRLTAATLIAVLAVSLAPPSAATFATNDSWNGALRIAALPFSAADSTLLATAEPGEPRPCGAGSDTVWYAFTPARTGDYDLRASSPFDAAPALALYAGATLATASLLGADCTWSCGQVVPNCETSLVRTLVGGVTYRIQLGGSPDFTLRVAAVPAGQQPAEVQSCFSYNPAAALNLCLWGDAAPVLPSVPTVPGVPLPPDPVTIVQCMLPLVGDFCVPGVSVRPGPIPPNVGVPGLPQVPPVRSPVHGYVEVTAACAVQQLQPPCREDL